MEQESQRPPPTILVANVFLLLDALLWLGFGIIVGAGAHPAIPDAAIVRWTMAVLAFLAAASLLALFFLLRRRSRPAFWLVLGLLAVISVLTVTDEFGAADLIVLLLHVAPLALLLWRRGWYLQPGLASPENQRTG